MLIKLGWGWSVVSSASLLKYNYVEIALHSFLFSNPFLPSILVYIRPCSVDSLDGGFFSSLFGTVGRSKIVM